MNNTSVAALARQGTANQRRRFPLSITVCGRSPTRRALTAWSLIANALKRSWELHRVLGEASTPMVPRPSVQRIGDQRSGDQRLARCSAVSHEAA